MIIRYRSQTVQISLFVILAILILAPSPAVAQTEKKVQEIEAWIESEGGLIYRIEDLLEGDRVSILLEGRSGNLDPLVGLADGDLDGTILRDRYRAEVEKVIAAGDDPLVAIPGIVDELFLAWDDDSGPGYSALLDFVVPEDGDYQLILTSSPLVDTFGDFYLQIGINAPEVLTGDAQPTGDLIAVLDFDASRVDETVQEVVGALSADNSSTFFTLRDFQKGDTLYVFVEAISGDLIPTVFLNDFGLKPVRSDNSSGSESTASFDYTFDDDGSNYRIDISACCGEDLLGEGEFRMLVGANVPEVLFGEAESRGQPILLEPIEARVAIQMQQITNVDQKAENFGVVATLQMEWNDPSLAFSPASCDCNFKIFDGSDFAESAFENDIVWPEFTLRNQQGRRFTQNQFVLVRPSGTATYFEQFTADLQAPDFDFRRFPFDTQEFYIRIDSLFPEEFLVFSHLEGASGVGDQLGEEEWTVLEFDTSVSSEEGNSRFSFRFEADRHLNFYVFRIFLPILIIIIVSWITFFLKDYGKRVDVAGANLLLFIAFNFTISDELPRLGYLTFLDTILITTFVITGFVLILNVILKRLEISGKIDLAQRLDRFMVWLYPVLYVGAIATVTILFV